MSNIDSAKSLVEKAPWLWIRNEKGEKSASLTLAFVAFVVCTIWVLLSAFENLGPVKVREFDATVAGVYLTPVLALYFARRATKASAEQQAGQDDQQPDVQDEQ